MQLSKSFGYAVRGVLYVAIKADVLRKVQIDEIARELAVPRHFLAKIMKRVVKEGILSSTKGPYGGFSVNDKTLEITIIKLIELTDGLEQFNSCVLRLKKCNITNPCPLHSQMEICNKNFYKIFAGTTIADLLKQDHPEFIRSIAIN